MVLSSLLFVNFQNTLATEEDTWQTLQPLPEQLSGTAVTVDDKIYIFSSQEYTTRLFVYDPQSQTLTQAASMPTNRAGFGIAVVDHKIYTIGGSHYYPLSGGAKGGYPTNVTEAYDTQTVTWEAKQPTIDQSSQLIANTVNGKIYAIYSGGKFYGSTMTGTGSNIDAYHPETDIWTRISVLPQEVSDPTFASAVDEISDTSRSAVTIGEGKLQIYDTATDTWSTGATLPTFYKQSRLVATTGEHVPKQIYIVGGAVIHGLTYQDGVSAVFRYDLASDSWSRAADMPTARYSPPTAVVDDKIYALGGATKMDGAWIGNLTSAVEVYTPFGYGTVQPPASSNPTQKEPDQPAQPLPVVVVAVAIAVAVSTGLIVYHKRKTQTTSSKQTQLSAD
jgi:hypothetical protein